jgi:hypothetical protein
MTHVNLDGLAESVKKFVLGVALDPAGSVLEFNGQPVAWVVPAGSQNGDEEEPWTGTKNQRRCDLIEREDAGGLSPAEAVELARLQEALSRHVQRVAPLPLEEARRLHEELLEKAAHAAKDDDPTV